MSDQPIIAHAKWILAGEHAVVRGNPALVVPLLDYTLRISTQDAENLQITCAHGAAPTLLFEGLVHSVCERFKQDPKTLCEHIHLDYNIPTGKGFGFSSALCVAMARWAKQKGWLHAFDITRFAQELEHQFHGKSSGVDIAGSTYNQPILYQMGHEPILMPHLPELCLILVDTDSKSPTKTAVGHVGKWFENNPEIGQAIDMQMNESVEMARQYLENPTASLTPLIEAMNTAETCFRTWSLIPDPVDHYIQMLKSFGALAVKPTGAGLGGLLISLWQKPPSNKQLANLPGHYAIATHNWAYEEVS